LKIMDLRKLTATISWAMVMTIGLAACGGGSSGSSTPPPAPPVAEPPPDTDGDGVADDDDDFPDDPNEDTDTDGDGVGDNSDNCVEDANPGQEDSDANGKGDVCDPMPLVYSAKGYAGEGTEDGVSYTGQTARQVLQLQLVEYMEDLQESPGQFQEVSDGLRFYVTGEGADETPHGFTVKGGTTTGEEVIPGPTYGDISTGKNLNGKIAGGSLAGTGETETLIDGEFFGWSTGLDATPLPIELVYYWMDLLAAEATDGADPTVSLADGSSVPIGTPMISATGVHYRQLIQKFLSVAVNFSQGTNDYLQADFANMLGEEKPGKGYSAGAHDFDEAFGYYGASRDLNDYTDDEAAGKSGRAEYENGYYDSNGDGLVDLRSEYVFGHAQNCAKRDRKKNLEGEAYTDYSKAAMDAFLVGRRILENAEEADELTPDADAALQGQIAIAGLTWEKCIAATVVHYINDVTDDMGEFVPPNYGDLSNFTTLAKHWGEMKGFALGLQFSPLSPFRTADSGVSVTDLKRVLSLMGDAPVLADGSQGGQATAAASAEAAIQNYLSDLREARDILEQAYGLDPEVVAIW
jgi:hypothetical protein